MYQVSETCTPYSEPDRPVVSRPEDVAKILEESGVFSDSRESFVVMFLDTRHRLIVPPYTVSVGNLNASLVHPRETFRQAIHHNSAAVIVAHNHPSGNPKPSSDDIELTKRLDQAGEILGIAVLDHVVVGSESHISIRELGWPT
jgi:DNA repair protein RadC